MAVPFRPFAMAVLLAPDPMGCGAFKFASHTGLFALWGHNSLAPTANYTKLL